MRPLSSPVPTARPDTTAPRLADHTASAPAWRAARAPVGVPHCDVPVLQRGAHERLGEAALQAGRGGGDARAPSPPRAPPESRAPGWERRPRPRPRPRLRVLGRVAPTEAAALPGRPAGLHTRSRAHPGSTPSLSNCAAHPYAARRAPSDA